jgi:hypothetical protein
MTAGPSLSVRETFDLPVGNFEVSFQSLIAPPAGAGVFLSTNRLEIDCQ